MTSRSILVTAAVAACFQFGCSSYRLRDGIWQLSFDAQQIANRLPFPIDKREVKVRVEWDDKDEREVVEIKANDEADGELEPMYGDIRIKDDDSAQLTIDYSDDHWSWRMFGRIRNSETVVGEHFMATARNFEDLTINGIWMLKWLREE